MTQTSSSSINTSSLPSLPSRNARSQHDSFFRKRAQPANTSSIPTITRRYSSFLFLIAPLLPPAPATAFSLGISGPKGWLKEQKKKAARFVLAPIEASRESLQFIYSSLRSGNAEMEPEEMQRIATSASRDCVPEYRNSLVAFQTKTGVEVCTFRLIVKNAASLLDEYNPLKLEAEVKLDDLIKSFRSLNNMMHEADFQIPPNREKIESALVETLSSLDVFEQSVKDCLDL